MKYSLQAREPRDILGTSYRPAINCACLKTAFLKLYKDIFLSFFSPWNLIKKTLLLCKNLNFIIRNFCKRVLVIICQSYNTLLQTISNVIVY